MKYIRKENTLTRIEKTSGLETSKAPTHSSKIYRAIYRAKYHCCKNIVMPFSLVLEIRSIHQALYSYINRRDFRLENMKGSL